MFTNSMVQVILLHNKLSFSQEIEGLSIKDTSRVIRHKFEGRGGIKIRAVLKKGRKENTYDAINDIPSSALSLNYNKFRFSEGDFSTSAFPSATSIFNYSHPENTQTHPILNNAFHVN